MFLEVCTPSLESVQAAVDAGAARIELCEDLQCGGLTPSKQLLEESLKLGINTQVLIRPKAGDFVYSEKEVRQMLADIKMAVALGAQGVVVGALKADGSLDISAIKELKAAANDLQISFHKAMDEVPKPAGAIEQLIDLGFNRILTSAGKTTALEGLPLLTHWQNTYGNRIEIMPGGSIRPENVTQFKGKGFAAIHSAAIPKDKTHSEQEVIEKMLQIIAS